MSASPAAAGQLGREFAPRRSGMMGLAVAVIALLVVLLVPAAKGLTPAGQVILAILAFSGVVWMTEALDYSVSAVVIVTLMIFMPASVPDASKAATEPMGTSAALAIALSAFASRATALVAGVCLIVSAMTSRPDAAS
jgi:di/tricarboxylate transporter